MAAIGVNQLPLSESIINQLWQDPYKHSVEVDDRRYTIMLPKTGAFNAFVNFVLSNKWHITTAPAKDEAEKNDLEVMMNHIIHVLDSEHIDPVCSSLYSEEDENNNGSTQVEKKSTSTIAFCDEETIKTIETTKHFSARAKSSLKPSVNGYQYSQNTGELTEIASEFFSYCEDYASLEPKVIGSTSIQRFVFNSKFGEQAQAVVSHMYLKIATAEPEVDFTYSDSFIPLNLFINTYVCPFTGKELSPKNAVQMKLINKELVGNQKSQLQWFNVSREGVRRYLTSKSGQFNLLPKNVYTPNQIIPDNLRAVTSENINGAVKSTSTFHLAPTVPPAGRYHI
ncbi:hypothetical protein D5R81_09530 [Parashewanella spongiae]|uniref:Uncharacterized protein n=1 Tax=Parashewanella spongiae TaxID=342950 RepID=A0A3A6TQF2_9GAMM|nr:hypothetical protein [Parashewanella spongiae]MCL1078131.1 hypothetical protein [Parashewanella spongiae]RJY16377.1 hypothetical protein D5R81_09530 [Parashewanella spongiae]